MKLLCCSLFLLFSKALCAQTGGLVYEEKTLNSKILGEERKYAIYLPPSYNESERTYPIVYLLHPAGPKGTIPNQQGWVNYGQLKQYMDNAIAKGEIAPMIVVTPDANFGTKRVSYFNDPKDSFNFENYFFSEFIPYIEKHINVVPIEIVELLLEHRWEVEQPFFMHFIIQNYFQ